MVGTRARKGSPESQDEDNPQRTVSNWDLEGTCHLYMESDLDVHVLGVKVRKSLFIFGHVFT